MSPDHGLDEGQQPGCQTTSMATGLSVLAAEAHGISRLHEIYSNDAGAQKAFAAAADTLVRTASQGGSVIVSGVGKSGLIGKKIVATLNSLGLRSFSLHPTEALHGDLGMIGPHDTLLLITFSGSTAELLSLVCHLPSTAPLILMSSAQPDPGAPISSLPLFAARIDAPQDSNILLSTPIPTSEKSLFGISAPTVSTTVTLALGDALAMAAAHKLHEDRDGIKHIFHRYHPGGAIGRAAVTDIRQETAPGDISPSNMSVVSPQEQSLEGSTVAADDYDFAFPVQPKAGFSDPGDGAYAGPTASPRVTANFLRLTADVGS